MLFWAIFMFEYSFLFKESQKKNYPALTNSSLCIFTLFILLAIYPLQPTENNNQLQRDAQNYLSATYSDIVLASNLSLLNKGKQPQTGCVNMPVQLWYAVLHNFCILKCGFIIIKYPLVQTCLTASYSSMTAVIKQATCKQEIISEHSYQAVNIMLVSKVFRAQSMHSAGVLDYFKNS